MERITHFIGGKKWEGSAERTGEVFNPASGEVIAHVDFATTEVVNDAVKAAQRAFVDWRTTSLAKRTQVLFAFREIVNNKKEELAAAITREHGKVLSDAKIGRAHV